MKKQTLVERFQKLAGIEPLQEYAVHDIFVYDVTDGWDNKRKVNKVGYRYKDKYDMRSAEKEAEAYIKRLQQSDQKTFDQDWERKVRLYKDNPEDLPPKPTFTPRKYQIGAETTYRSME